MTRSVILLFFRNSQMKWQTTRKMTPWTTTAIREVWPDIKTPLLPGGSVSKTPGERRIKSTRESQDILSRWAVYLV